MFKLISPVLAVAADVAVAPLYDGVDPHQPVSVACALGSAKPPCLLFLLLLRRGVGNADLTDEGICGKVRKVDYIYSVIKSCQKPDERHE